MNNFYLIIKIKLKRVNGPNICLVEPIHQQTKTKLKSNDYFLWRNDI